MPARPLNVEIARRRIRRITDRGLQELAERALTAALERFYRSDGTPHSAANGKLPAADFDLLFFVEILAATQPAAADHEPWRTAAQEFFGAVPAGGFEEEEPVEEDLGPPEELAFPEDVLRPIEEEPSGHDDLGLSLVSPEVKDPFACFESESFEE